MSPNDEQNSNNANNQEPRPIPIVELTPEQRTLTLQRDGLHHHISNGEQQVVDFNLRREQRYSHAHFPLNLLASSLSDNNESDNESNDQPNSSSLDR